MSERSVVGIYETMERAEEAVHRLDHESFPIKHISIVTQNLGDWCPAYHLSAAS